MELGKIDVYTYDEELKRMHQSGKEKIIIQPEQQILCCSAEEAVAIAANTLCVDEMAADYSSISEQIKRLPRKTFR